MKSLQDDKKCELIVVIDCHMTSSAKYADILLPAAPLPNRWTLHWMHPAGICLTLFSMIRSLNRALNVRLSVKDDQRTGKTSWRRTTVY
ncbi:hypothetical protein DMI62_06635 [Escherichia coli]|nr:hypothetical protein [Escherichia coli]